MREVTALPGVEADDGERREASQRVDEDIPGSGFRWHPGDTSSGMRDWTSVPRGIATRALPYFRTAERMYFGSSSSRNFFHTGNWL